MLIEKFTVYSSYIHPYLFLSLVYPPLFLYTFLAIHIDAYLFLSLYQSKFMAIPFKLVFFIPLYSLYIHLYLFLSLIYPSLFPYTSLSMQIDSYLFLSLCQSKFTAISLKPVFLSVYSLFIHLYIFLSLVYPPLFLYISLSIQIDAYLFQPHFHDLSLILIYPTVSILLSFLSTTISFPLLFIQI